MGSDKYFFLLLAFFFSNVLGHHEEGSFISKVLGLHKNGSNDLSEEDDEIDPNNLIPYEDTLASLEELNKFKQGFGVDWIMMPNDNGNPMFSNYGNDSNTDLDNIPVPDPTDEILKK